MGESENYHKPPEQELLDDYLNAVNNLTINEENRLKLKVQLLEGESNEIQDLKRKFNEQNANMQRLAQLIELNIERSSGYTFSPGSNEDISQKTKINDIADELQKKGVKVAGHFDQRSRRSKSKAVAEYLAERDLQL